MRLRMGLGRRLSFCIVVGTAAIVSGCGLYLHDEAAAAKSAATRDAWAKVSAEANTNIALRNIDAVAKEELRIVEDQARVNLSLALLDLTTETWEGLEAKTIEKLRENIKDFTVTRTETAANAPVLQKLKDAFKDATVAVAAAKKAVTDEENAHPLEIAEARLSAVASKTSDAAAAKAYRELQDALKSRDLAKIEKAETEFAKAAKASSDADLKARFDEYEKARASAPSARDLRKVIVELQTATTAISKGSTADLSKIQSSLKGVSEGVTKLRKILERTNAESQPGLKLIMLGFAVDVAIAERDRLAEQIRQTAAAVQAAKRREDRLGMVIVDAAAILNQIHGNTEWVRNQLLLPPGMDPATVTSLVGPRLEENDQKLCGGPGLKDPILLTLRSQADAIAKNRRAATPAARPKECRYDEEALEANVLALIEYASLVGYQKYHSRVEQHEASIASHRGVRREDLINSREREQLISRTLDGLALFYKGGITKEDIARIAALAEGLFIAVGVNR